MLTYSNFTPNEANSHVAEVASNGHITLDKQTKSLLTHLWKGGEYSYYWTLADKTTHWFKVTGTLTALPNTENVYFGVHPVGEVPSTNSKGERTKPSAIRAGNEHIVALNAIHADFDAKDFGDDKAAALTHIRSLNIQPSALIDSGGGYHGYYFLNETTHITDENRSLMKDLIKRFARYVGSDSAATDLNRVLRVPGTFNTKDDKRRLVEWVECDFNKLYSLGEIELLLPITGAVELDDGSDTSKAALWHRYSEAVVNRKAKETKFRWLWNATNDVFHGRDALVESQSEGDIQLTIMLGGMTKWNEADTIGLFKLSGAYRGEAKSGGDDYVKRTFDKAYERYATPSISTTNTGAVKDPLGFMSEDELDRLPPPKYLVPDLITEGEIVCYYGRRGSGKTTAAMDAACQASRSLPVLYLAGEDVFGARIRRRAWLMHHNEAPKRPFITGTVAFHLLQDDGLVDELIRRIKENEYKLVVVDSLTHFATGIKENDSSPTTSVMGVLRRIANETNAAILLIHHAGKTGDGPRGFSGIEDVCYASFRFEKPSDESAQTTMSAGRPPKNSAPIKDRHYTLTQVEVGRTADGEPQTSVVLVDSGMTLPHMNFGIDYKPPTTERILEAFRELRATELRAKQIKAQVELSEGAFSRAIEVLKKEGLVEKDEGNVRAPYCLTAAGRSKVGV